MHHVQPFAFAFAFLVVIVFLCVVVAVVVCSSTWSPAVFRPVPRVLPQFLHVLMSALLVWLVLFVRVPLWLWCLPLPFTLHFLGESTCILFSSSAPVPIQADTVGGCSKFLGTMTPKLFEERNCLHEYPTSNCPQVKSVPYSSLLCA